MAAPVKVRKVGNSLGVILTKDVVESLGVAEGDELFAVRTPDGNSSHSLRSALRQGDRVDARLHAPPSRCEEDEVLTMVAVADSSLSEHQFAHWLRRNCTRAAT